MKLLVLAAVLTLATNAFAHNHEEGKKKQGHDKEHSHVEGASMDHVHDDAHHQDHDHKAHHPEHDDKKEIKDKKKKK